MTRDNRDAQRMAMRKSIDLELEIDELKKQLSIPIDSEQKRRIEEQINDILSKKPVTKEDKKEVAKLRKSIALIPAPNADEIKERINILQKESDELWEYAKSFTDPKVVQKGYENLANAIIRQAVLDYSALLSDKSLPPDNIIRKQLEDELRDGKTRQMRLPKSNKRAYIEERSKEIHMEEIMDFAKTYTGIFTNVDLAAVLKRIKNTRNNVMLPYVAENEKQILKDYNSFNKSRKNKYELFKHFPHRCPICGGALVPVYAKLKKSKAPDEYCCIRCNTGVNASEVREYQERHKAV